MLCDQSSCQGQGVQEAKNERKKAVLNGMQANITAKGRHDDD